MTEPIAPLCTVYRRHRRCAGRSTHHPAESMGPRYVPRSTARTSHSPRTGYLGGHQQYARCPSDLLHSDRFCRARRQVPGADSKIPTLDSRRCTEGRRASLQPGAPHVRTRTGQGVRRWAVLSCAKGIQVGRGCRRCRSCLLRSHMGRAVQRTCAS